ncbi:ParA family partition ATPase [Salinibacter altiplanensis]|uniref:ParA family partition ATPase n=1 Tax=Salinibacter altiplanensis TaxID=1803181 RepID=UPI000C9FDE0F|nr:ParA family partition ATPase [Salinibacter altiplanensis]
MGLVIGVVNAKGGSGKTTLATNLARAIQLDGNEVAMVDTDPQRTATTWGEKQPEGYGLPVRPVGSDYAADTLQKRIESLVGDSTFGVIDGSAKIAEGTGAAVGASDVVLIPIQPTPADTWGARSVVEVIKESETPAAFVISRQIVGTNLAKEVAEGLKGYELPVFDHRTSQRVAYAEAMFDGKTVLDISGAQKAREEIQGIATELAQLLRSD